MSKDLGDSNYDFGLNKCKNKLAFNLSSITPKGAFSTTSSISLKKPDFPIKKI
jgi:hypothetical protein